MRDIDEVLGDICAKRAEYKKLIDQRDTMLNSTQNLALRDEAAKMLQKYIDSAKAEMRAAVGVLIQWPPHKLEHFDKLDVFFAKYPYEKSVFIMTKYPNLLPDKQPKTQLDAELLKVIDAVKTAVTDCGYAPHLASDFKYQPELFRNIEVYMLACAKAIAIVESKHTQELNPNVTMEWGWLRSTPRDVLYLVEQDFDHDRADIGGLIKDNFDWKDPGPGIKAAIASFLKQ
jgi:hypothetical protein